MDKLEDFHDQIQKLRGELRAYESITVNLQEQTLYKMSADVLEELEEDFEDVLSNMRTVSHHKHHHG